MFMEKWNYQKQAYEPYSVPSDWEPRVVCSSMNDVISCASCGERIAYGESYTSKVIHNSIGFGYMVCPRCHVHEIAEEMEAVR